MEVGLNVMLSGTRRGLRTLILGLVVATSLASGSALGQGAPQSAPSAKAAEAKQHFEQGVDAAKAGKWPEARQEFATSYALSPELKCLALLSSAEMKTEHYREAAQHLAMLLEHKAELNETTLAEARKMLADAKAKIGSATIQVNVEGADVLVDGVRMGRSRIEGEIFVDAGSRTFEAKKEGFAKARIVIDVKAGTTPTVVLELRKEGPVRNNKVLYSGIGVTGGLALVGIGLGVVANNLLYNAAVDRQYGNGCSNEDACELQYNELHSTRSKVYYGAVGANIGAGIAGAATLVYALVTRKRDDGVAPRAEVIMGPGGGALVLTGRF